MNPFGYRPERLGVVLFVGGPVTPSGEGAAS